MLHFVLELTPFNDEFQAVIDSLKKPAGSHRLNVETTFENNEIVRTYTPARSWSFPGQFRYDFSRVTLTTNQNTGLYLSSEIIYDTYNLSEQHDILLTPEGFQDTTGLQTSEEKEEAIESIALSAQYDTYGSLFEIEFQLDLWEGGLQLIEIFPDGMSDNADFDLPYVDSSDVSIKDIRVLRDEVHVSFSLKLYGETYTISHAFPQTMNLSQITRAFQLQPPEPTWVHQINVQIAQRHLPDLNSK